MPALLSCLLPLPGMSRVIQLKVSFIKCHAIFTSFFIILNPSYAIGSFDVDFFNVGQGHCCIARTKHNGIIIIDAGSSSTYGLDNISQSNKYSSLAKNIYSSIQTDLEKPQEINCIVTHCHPDHFNLFEHLLEKIKQHTKPQHTIKFIFGGKKEEYQIFIAISLTTYLINHQIPFIFGSEFSQDLINPLLYNPPAPVSNQQNFQFTGDEVEFLSVENETNQELNNPNASSIVLRIKGGGWSVMITGDKTKNSLQHLIELYNGHEDQLKSDVLLATHHGAREDFNKKWLKHVNPYFYIVSSGLHNYAHPRYDAICSSAVLTNLQSLNFLEWHPIRSCDDKNNDGLSLISKRSKLIPISARKIQSDAVEYSYAYSMTKAGIYVTADQGTIKLSLDGNDATISTEKNLGKINYVDSYIKFIFNKDNIDEWSTIKIDSHKAFNEFSKNLEYSWIDRYLIFPDQPEEQMVFRKLKIITLNYQVPNKATKYIIRIFETLLSLSNFNTTSSLLTKKNLRKIGKAWEKEGHNLSSLKIQ